MHIYVHTHAPPTHTQTQPKIGLLLACPTKDSQLEQVRVELQQKTLLVMRHDMVYEDVMANYVSPQISCLVSTQ